MLLSVRQNEHIVGSISNDGVVDGDVLVKTRDVNASDFEILDDDAPRVNLQILDQWTRVGWVQRSHRGRLADADRAGVKAACQHEHVARCVVTQVHLQR